MITRRRILPNPIEYLGASLLRWAHLRNPAQALDASGAPATFGGSAAIQTFRELVVGDNLEAPSAPGRPTIYTPGSGPGLPILMGDAVATRMQGAVGVTPEWLFIMATVKAADTLRLFVPPILLNGDRGLVNTAGAAASNLAAVGFNGTSRFTNIVPFDTYGLNGDYATYPPGNALLGIESTRNLYAFRRATGYGPGPLSIFDDRGLGLAGRFWAGGACEVMATGPLTLAQRNYVGQWMSYWWHTERVVTVGDSLTFGYNVTASQTWPNVFHATHNGCLDVTNCAIPGYTFVNMAANDPAIIDPYLTAARFGVLAVWAGTNDIGTTVYLVNGGDPITTFDNMKAYCRAAKARHPGLKIIIASLTPRNDAGMFPGFEARRQVYNGLLRADFSVASGFGARIYAPTSASVDYADILVDIGDDPLMGQAGDENNLTYYLADLIHFAAGGQARVESVYFRPAINGLLALAA